MRSAKSSVLGYDRVIADMDKMNFSIASGGNIAAELSNCRLSGGYWKLSVHLAETRTVVEKV